MIILVAFSTVFTSLHLLSIILRSFEPTAEAEVRGIMLISLIAIPILLFTDYAQSLVIAALNGILAPTYMSKRAEARLVGVAGFLMLQASAYFLWMLLATASAKGVNTDYNGWVIILIITATIMSIIRELVVMSLMRLLARRLDCPLQEGDTQPQATV
jgi:hypothetical protein